MSTKDSSALRLLIVGGTGQTGRVLVDQALAQGHQVRVLARNPEKAATLPDEVEVQLGDAIDPQAIHAAVSDQDAVLCAIGGQGLSDSSTRSRATQPIVAAMHAQSVARLVVCSVVGLGASTAHLGWFSRMLTGMVLKNALADHQKQEELVCASTLDWVIFRPPQLTNGALTEGYKLARETDAFSASKVSRADVAHAMLRAVQSTEWVGQRLSISS